MKIHVLIVKNEDERCRRSKKIKHEWPFLALKLNKGNCYLISFFTPPLFNNLQNRAH